MLRKKLHPDFEWHELTSQVDDLAYIDIDIAKHLLFNLMTIREFENALLQLVDHGCVKGPVHTCIGQEQNGAAAIAALRCSDKVSGTHRAHHQFIAKLLQHALPDVWDPTREDLPTAGQEVLRRTLAEVLGLEPGYCRGHGGSMHLRYAEAGFIGSNAVVGGGIPISTGAAFAEKYRRTGNVVVCFFGDGASNQGTFHEACNIAGAWRLPIIYFIENNMYAGTTSSETVCAVRDLSARALSYGMEGMLVDGTDTLSIYEAVRYAAAMVRDGGPPCIIESKCYRYCHHMGGQKGSEVGYRSRAEEEAWLCRDALEHFPASLVRAGKLSQQDVRRIGELAQTSVARAVDFCTAPGAVRTVRPVHWPKAEIVHESRRSNGEELKDVVFKESDDFPSHVMKTYANTVASVLTHWFSKDPSTVLIGEEVADPESILDPNGSGVPERFRAQVLNTPISESGFVGLACGAALSGMRPVVEIMYSDFVLVAADQLFNQIEKIRSIYGSKVPLPIVVRTKVAIGFGYGGQHSMNPIGLFSLFPGWRIVVPSTAADYIGLFNTAMQSADPVLVVENRSLYDNQFFIPKDELSYLIPFGRAKVVAQGEQVTVITYGIMVKRCEDLHNKLAAQGVSIEIIDLRTVDPFGIDYETIGDSLQKTGKAVVVEEAAASQGIGKIIAANLTERYFPVLSCPIRCIAAADIPAPASPILESAFMVDDMELAAWLKEMAQQGKSLFFSWGFSLPMNYGRNAVDVQSAGYVQAPIVNSDAAQEGADPQRSELQTERDTIS